MSHFVIGCYAFAILLLPVSRLSELPILILAIIGVVTLLRFFKDLKSDSRFKILNFVYFPYLALILFSLPDSYWQEKTLLVGLASLRFYFATIALIYFSDRKHLQWFIKIPALICLAWALDALVQYFFGTNLVGLKSYPGRLNGVFGEHHAKLGPVLALLFPCLLIQLVSFHKSLKWLSLLLIAVVVLLSGTRSAWLMLAFTLAAFFISHVKQNKLLLMSKTIFMSLVLMVGLWFLSSDFQDRVNRTVSAFDGSVSSLDFALANRLPIWNVSVEIIKNHPINGVGAHAFRKAYPVYAADNDIWQKNGGVGMHAHHWVLEILSETGMIGLLLLSFAIYKLLVFIRANQNSNLTWPFATAIMAAFLPIVSTYSVFASFWSICLWIVGAGLITVSHQHD